MKIRYDYVPKYCKTSKILGHDEEAYYVLHPELFYKKNGKGVGQDDAENKSLQGST